jgi:hypothetical protein
MPAASAVDAFWSTIAPGGGNGGYSFQVNGIPLLGENSWSAVVAQGEFAHCRDR